MEKAAPLQIVKEKPPSTDGYSGLVFETFPGFVLSQVDETRKYTLSCAPCIAHILAGISSRTGERVSFLGHFSNTIYIPRARQFEAAFTPLLQEAKGQLQKGSVVSAIAGGDIAPWEVDGEDFLQDAVGDYLCKIRRVSRLVEKHLEVQTHVVQAPKTNGAGSTNVYCDTPAHTLYLHEAAQADSIMPPYFAVEEAEKIVRDQVRYLLSLLNGQRRITT